MVFSLKKFVLIFFAEDFGHQLTALATQMGNLYQDEETLDTEEVVVIGDGAAWIWNLADEHFPGATEIIDYMHAKTHLYDLRFGFLAKECSVATGRSLLQEWKPLAFCGYLL